MGMYDKNEYFSYTYSAKEKEEIRRIREKYTQKTESESRMDKLRKLDKSVANKATAFSLVFGVVGSLLFGTGMSFITTDLKNVFANNLILSIIVGIFIGILGMVLMITAYPIYIFITKREREKIAPEIIRLADEIINNQT